MTMCSGLEGRKVIALIESCTPTDGVGGWKVLVHSLLRTSHILMEPSEEPETMRLPAGSGVREWCEWCVVSG